MLSQKYGSISDIETDKESFLDFDADDDAAKQWSEKVYGEWTMLYPTYIKNVYRSGSFANYWSTNDPLAYYCGNVYENANRYYRLKGTGNDLFDSMKTEINRIIEDAPRNPNNIVVYRALRDVHFWDFKKLNNLHMPFVELGLLSTSLTTSILTKKQEAPNFATYPYVFKIFVPRGTKAICVHEVGKIIENLSRPEIELLFPSESKLYMMSYPYKQWGKTVIDCYLSL